MFNIRFENFFCKNRKIISFYSTNPTSKKLANAFSKPINGCTAAKWEDVNQDLVTTIFFFGVPELWPLFDHVKNKNLDWLYADKGYFGRGTYYRISKNSIQLNKLDDVSEKRLKKFNIRFKDQKKNGSKILLCPQSDIFFRLHGLTRESWVRDTIKEIRKYSDRPIEVRDKNMNNTELDFSNSLEDVHAVIVYTSIAGVQSAINGVPCFATGDGVSRLFSSGLIENIENPTIPENIYQIACALANNQWTIGEIKSGMPHYKFGI